MFRRILLSLVLVAIVAPLAAAQDDPVLGKKREEWLKILKEHKEVKFRRAAVIALNVVGVKRPQVLEGYIAAMENDPEAEVRREIAAMIGGQEPAEVKGAVDALAVRLEKDKDETVRHEAARALGKLAQFAGVHATTLGRALKDPSPQTRAAAAEALKEFGDKAKIVVPQLLEAAQDAKTDRVTRLYAIEILSKQAADDDKTGKVLVQILEDDKAHPSLRLTAAKGLALMGPAAASTIPQLSKIAQDMAAELELRRAAAVALGKMGDKTAGAWPTVKTLLSSKDTGLRYQAVRMAGALGKGNKEATTAIVEMLDKEQNTDVLLAMIQEVGELSAMDAVKTLTRIVANDTRLSIREAAQASLKKITGS